MNQSPDILDTCTLHVCTSCRPAGTPRGNKETRAGFILYQQLCNAIQNSLLHNRVEVKPAECLSLCPRPCGIALSSNEAWTYLFGDQQPNKTALDIVDCISRYLNTPDGFLPRNQRPTSLQGSILGRVPPIRKEIPCT